MNLLFSEWGNRGVHLFKVEQQTQALTQGTAQYTVPTKVSDVLEAFISTSAGVTTDTQDVSLTKIDRSAFAALPNKGAQGQPSQYYVDRQNVPIINLYL